MSDNAATDRKRRWNEKTYTTVRAAIPKELASRFKETAEARGDSQASIIKDAILLYLEQYEERK